MGLTRCAKLRSAKALGVPKKAKDGFGQQTSAHLDYRNGLLSRIAKQVPGAVAVLESPGMGSLRRLRKEGVAARRVHVINKSAAGRFCQKARRLGATPHVCMFHEFAEKASHPVDVLYYDGTRGHPLNAYQDLRPFVELGRARPKVLMVTVAKRCNTYVPQTTRVGALMRWLSSAGYMPLGGWTKAAQAVSSGKVYCFAMHRLGRDGLRGGLLQTPEDFALKEGKTRLPPGLPELRERLDRLAQEAAPPSMSSHEHPVAARVEVLRNAVELAGGRRLAQLQAHGPRWFWAHFAEWRRKAAGSQSRLRNLPEAKRRELFLRHFDALAAALSNSFATARRVVLLLDRCARRSELEAWARGAVAAGARLGSRGSGDLVLAPLLDAADFEQLVALAERAARAVRPGGVLALTIQAAHDATALLWALELEGHLCARGFKHLAGFDPRMLTDLSELATVTLRQQPC